MTFLQPLLLFALPLVTLPVIIHLINQRRYQTIRWAAKTTPSANASGSFGARTAFFCGTSPRRTRRSQNRDGSARHQRTELPTDIGILCCVKTLEC